MKRIFTIFKQTIYILIVFVLSAFEAHGQLYESFEGLTNIHKANGSGALICDGMPMPGWSKIQPPHYDSYNRNIAGGYGWQAGNAGRSPMAGWISGTHSVPPTEGAGNISAYITYTHGGSKENDSILITPKLLGSKSTTQLSFWYKPSFTNFADNLYCLISTNETVDSLEDFTIEAWHRYMPRGDMTNDFGDPWQQITIDVGSHVPEGTPFYVGFREYYNNNWYDVRAIELDVIEITDVYATPIVKVNNVYTEGANLHVDYDIFGGTPIGDVYIVWGASPNPTRYGDWNSQKVEQETKTCIIEDFPAYSKMYVRAYVDHLKGGYYSDEEFIVYAGDADGEGYIFESFEEITNIHKVNGNGALICDGMPMPGWAKIQPPHYDSYNRNIAGGYGWMAGNAGRSPMAGWISGTHSVPPTEGAGNQTAYITYNHGGSKENDSILVTPILENIKPDYKLSFWYKPSFTNFADNIYCLVSTDTNPDTLEDFNIEAWHRYMPRGNMDGDFGEPWHRMTLDIGSMVAEGSDIRIGFREYYNNNWYDVRANELDVISSVDGRPRSSLSFDGTDDYIPLHIKGETPAYTIEAWVRPLSASSQSIIVRTPGDPLTGYSRQLRINSSGQFEHYLYDGSAKTVTNATPVVPGKWYHITGTAANNGEIKLFVNGNEEGTALPVGTIASHGTNVLAGCATGEGYGFFNGEMDEIRFWDKVLTEDEIRNHINTYTRGTEDNLEACYHLDNTEGEDLFDSHDNGENGNWFGNPFDSYVFRKQQPYYNGIDDYTFLPDTNLEPYYTLEAWVYPIQTGAQSIMVLSDGDTEYSFNRHLRINSENRFEFYNYDGTERTLTGTSTMQPNNWYHIVVTAKNGGYMKIYVNGQFEGEVLAGNTTWGSGLLGYYVGKIAAHNNYNWFKGRIIDTSETDYVKDQDQIINEYNAARTPVIPTTSWPQWVDSTAPIGDYTSAKQWYPRGAWNAMPNGTTYASHGLSVTSSISALGNYVVYGDNDDDGIVTDEIKCDNNAMRMNRVWHIGTYNQPSYTLDLTFNATDAAASEMCNSELIDDTGQYQLLRRDDTTSNFSIHTASASSVSATDVSFNGVSITEGYYTLAMLATPAPAILPATDVTAHSFTANWDTSTQQYVTGYYIDISSDNFASLLINNLGVGDVSSWNITSLNPDTLYCYRVRSEFQELTSTNSATETVQTLTEGDIEFGTSPIELQTTYGTNCSNNFQLLNTGETAYSASYTITYAGSTTNWLSFYPATPTVEALSSTNIDAMADAETIIPGTYWATGVFYSATADNSPQSLPVSVTITKAPAQIQISNLSQTYDGSAKSITVTTTPVGLSTDITYNGSGTPPSQAGSYAVSATINDACYVGSTNATLVISKASQSITSFTPTDGSSFASTQVVTMISSASSGLPVSFKVLSGPVILFGDNELRFTGADSVQAQASQAGNANYNPISQNNTYTITDTTPTHYVAQNGQTAYPPYASWETAATNIQDAIDLAVAGDTVVVDDGTYNIGSYPSPIGAGSPCRFVADKSITLNSLNGPQTTIIFGGGTSNGLSAVRGGYIGNGCNISGFTFTNGHTWTTGDGWTDKCGGGLFLNTTGVVENCQFTGNSASAYGGGIYLYNGGTVKRSVLSNNTGGGGGGISFYRGGRIENSLIIDNYSGGEGGGTFTWWGGEIVNCTISGNSASGIGDGAMFYQGGSLYNSIVIGNGNSEVYFKEYTPITAKNFISGDPKFADPSTSDYRLECDSPCIDSGTNLWIENDVDLDNTPRVIKGIVDIGCYQTPQDAGNALNTNPSEYIFKLQNPNDFDFSLAFTIECWIKTENNGQILSKQIEDGSWTSGGKQFGTLNGYLSFGVYNVGTYTGGPYISDGKWHHVAVTCSTSPRTIKLFVDGNLQTEDQPSNWTVELNPSNLRVGKITGCIDELRFWKSCRTIEQIRYNMFRPLRGDEDSLQFYTRADQSADNRIIDLADNDNTGIPTNYNASNLWTKSYVPIASPTMEQEADINAYWNACLIGQPWYTNGLKIVATAIDADKPIITSCDDISGVTTDQIDSSTGQRMTRFWRIEMPGNNNITPILNIENAEAASLGYLLPVNYLLLKRTVATNNFSSTSKQGTSRTDAQIDIETYSLSSGEYTLGTTPDNLVLSPNTLSLTYRRGTPAPAPLYCTLSNTGGTAAQFSSTKNYYPADTNWLTITPSIGTIPPESSLVVTAELSNLWLQPIECSATNSFNTNDSSATLGCLLTVLKQQFTITSSVGNHGTISPLGSTVVEENDNLNFTMTPEQWYCVSNVLLNGSPIGPVTNYAWNNIVDDGTIYASFTAICITNDHIDPVPEFWLAQFGLTNDMQDAVEEDPDFDGAETWKEYIAGTDPTNSQSIFIISAQEPVLGTNYREYIHNFATNPPPDDWRTSRVYEVIGYTLSWPSYTGRFYDVMYGTNLPGTWFYQDGASNIPATPPINTITNPLPVNNKFYRINVRLP